MDLEESDLTTPPYEGEGKEKKNQAPLETTSLEATEIAEAKAAIEALLFASDQPLNAMQLTRILPYEKEAIENWLLEIEKEFEQKNGGFKLYRIQGGFKWLTQEHVAKYVEQLPGIVQLEKLSLAGCEVLALLSQNGSLTRGEIEKLRGVDSSGVIQSLIERELIESHIRADAPGLPHEFRLTLAFYTRFGINQRKDLQRLFLHRFASSSEEPQTLNE